MDVKSLQQAFAQFSEQTVRLEETYRTLQEKYIHLSSKLATSSRTLEIVIGHIPEGLIFIEENGTINLFNAAASYLLNYPAEEVIGKEFWTLFEDNFFGFSLKKAFEEKRVPRTTYLSLTHQKKQIDLEVSISTFPEKGLIFLLRDLTEQRLLEQTLQRNDRLKELGEMAAGLAHEIRNPLGGIQGFASLLARELSDSPHLSQMAQAIVEGTRTLNRLVANVLDYSRPLKLYFSLFDPEEFFQEIIALAHADPLFKATIVFESSSIHHSLFADKEMLKMAVFNLVQNAAQASPQENAKIYFSLSETPQEILLSVQDEGEGIPPEHLEKIFTPFFTTKAQGTGLGLSESQKILQAHGGKIEVVSETGKGSTFTLRLPKHAT